MQICPVCNGVAKKEFDDFRAEYGGVQILVPKVGFFRCINVDCDYEWLPMEEREKIDAALDKHGIMYAS